MCQINPIDVNFHRKKSFEIFDEKLLTKSYPKRRRRKKYPPLMPIRVKELHLLNKISLIIDLAVELLGAKNDIVNRNLLSKRHVNNFLY